MIADLVRKCRSYRRFYQGFNVSLENLMEMVDNGRLSASGRNAQSLKYMISNDVNMNNKIFSCLVWAGYLKDWNGPEKEEQPSAYIVMLNDTLISTNYLCDHGIAAQSILLTAVEKGLGGCIIGAVKRDNLRQLLIIPEQYEIVQVIALGKPKEEVKIEQVGSDGDIRYWRDEHQIHHVPKRSLEDVILKF